MEKQKILKEQEKKRSDRKDAQESLAYQMKMSQERNSMGKRRFNWVSKCFKHFFEKFTKIDDSTKDKILNLEKRIEDTYEKNEEFIRDNCQMVKDANTVAQVHGTFDGKFNDNVIQREWQRLEGIIGQELKNILAEIKDLDDKSTKWYCVLLKIRDIYEPKFTGNWWSYWKKGDYLPKPFTTYSAGHLVLGFSF